MGLGVPETDPGNKGGECCRTECVGTTGIHFPSKELCNEECDEFWCVEYEGTGECLSFLTQEPPYLSDPCAFPCTDGDCYYQYAGSECIEVNGHWECNCTFVLDWAETDCD